MHTCILITLIINIITSRLYIKRIHIKLKKIKKKIFYKRHNAKLIKIFSRKLKKKKKQELPKNILKKKTKKKKYIYIYINNNITPAFEKFLLYLKKKKIHYINK
uniref:Uncharacterized protein n=1 Tax=Glossina palpalis gambiensis TaxID=67801 RepID=A0A1B0AMU0_9MUSC